MTTAKRHRATQNTQVCAAVKRRELVTTVATRCQTLMSDVVDTKVMVVPDPDAGPSDAGPSLMPDP